MMKFDLPKDQSSIIKVIGVGGGGSNAVNHMFRQGITGVDFMICNTDQQALDISPVPNKVQLGSTLTEGRGAGSIPDVGRNAALENIEELKEHLALNTKMVFITAGMGGGTGTGAAPIIAQIAKEMGILTVGIVTYPFSFEGRKRKKQADLGLEEMRQHVDTLLVINNDKLREMYGNLSLSNAFAEADNILTTAAKGIAEIITVTGYINVDFEDVKTVMTESGAAIMGSATAEGDDRAMRAAERALASPLLNDNNIIGAKYILLNITFGGTEILMDEISEITDYIQDQAGDDADIIFGTGIEEELGEKINVTLIATGFESNKSLEHEGVAKEPQKVVHQLDKEEEAPKGNHFKPEATTPEVQEPELIIREPAPEPEPQPEVPQAVQASLPLEVERPPVEEKPAPQPVQMKMESAPVEMPVVEETQQPVAEVRPEPVEEVKPQAKDVTDEHNGLPDGWVVKSVSEGEVPQPKKPALEQNLEEAGIEDTGDTSSRKQEELEEQLRRSQERIMKLKAITYKMKTPSGISELENQPAYERKNIKLDDVPHSSESQVSRYTLGEGEGDEGPELRSNNSFLHDNVD